MSSETPPRLRLEVCHQCGLPSVTFRDLRQQGDRYTEPSERLAVTVDLTRADASLDEFPAAQSF